MNKSNYFGLYTALVTPFKHDYSIDYCNLLKIIDFQIESKVNGLVILGTTGESPTINISEYKNIIKCVVKHVDKKINIIVGSGSNNTNLAIKKSKIAEDFGADMILSVSPYYNKPSQKDLINHFSKISQSTSLPIILYNIIGRTGININVETILTLSLLDNIIGVKESSGDIVQIMDLMKNKKDDFHIISGDDLLTYPFLSLGISGLISVISNIFPKEMKDLVNYNNLNISKNIHYKFYNLMQTMTMNDCSNPVPIKTIMAYLNQIEEVFREPLLPVTKNLKDKIISTYKEIA